MINVLWMYPDILNLHGERANAKAFEVIGKKLGLKVKIDRLDDLDEKVEFDKYDILLFNAGQLKEIEVLSNVLKNQINDLKKYIKDKKIIFVTGTTGALFSNNIQRLDGTSFKGLNIFDADIKEREYVLGDDLYFGFKKMKIVGPQIQMIDIDIKDEKPFGKVIYGYGNNGKGDEGIIKNNVIFTNTLGPVLVKNPWLLEYLFDLVIKNKKLKVKKKKIKYDLEKKSLESCEAFINKKLENK
ncbi:MAG: hypothetical protein IJ105_00550 [Bacilli bacterium]|nr:hypothetical protein [Bacilli bacterium]